MFIFFLRVESIFIENDSIKSEKVIFVFTFNISFGNFFIAQSLRMERDVLLFALGLASSLGLKSHLKVITSFPPRSKYKMHNSNQKLRKANNEFRSINTNRIPKKLHFGFQGFAASTSITATIPNGKITGPVSEKTSIQQRKPWNSSPKLEDRHPAIKAVTPGTTQDVVYKPFKARPVPGSHYEPYRPVLPSEKHRPAAKELDASEDGDQTTDILLDGPASLRNQLRSLFDPVNYYFNHRTWHLRPSDAEHVFESRNITETAADENKVVTKVPPMANVMKASTPIANAVQRKE